MLRDWTNSDKVNSLSANAERFFIRLIMKADDHGAFYADARLLKANLFPLLLENTREADISRWMVECQKAGLIVLYECADKKYLQIVDFRQRLDKARSKFPLPKSTESLTTVIEFPAELEVEPEVKVNKASTRSASPPNAPNFKKLTERQFYESIALFSKDYPKETLRAFYDYWREPSPNGTMKFQLQKTWDVALRLKTWKTKEKEFSHKNGRVYDDQPVSAPLKKLNNGIS